MRGRALLALLAVVPLLSFPSPAAALSLAYDPCAIHSPSVPFAFAGPAAVVVDVPNGLLHADETGGAETLATPRLPRAVSPDGRFLVTTRDLCGPTQVHDLVAGTAASFPDGAYGMIAGEAALVLLDSDGLRVYRWGAWDSPVRIAWGRAHEGSPAPDSNASMYDLQTFPGKTQPIALSSDGRFLAVAHGGSATLHRIEPSGAVASATLGFGFTEVQALAFEPNGTRLLALTSADGAAELHLVEADREVPVIAGSRPLAESIGAFHWGPAGIAYVAAGELRLAPGPLDLAPERARALAPPEAMPFVGGLRWSPDGARLALLVRPPGAGSEVRFFDGGLNLRAVVPLPDDATADARIAEKVVLGCVACNITPYIEVDRVPTHGDPGPTRLEAPGPGSLLATAALVALAALRRR